VKLVFRQSDVNKRILPPPALPGAVGLNIESYGTSLWPTADTP